jgi:hypothetical protein
VSIIEQIKALPEVKNGYFVWQAPNEQLEGGFRPEDLTALAESHERLLNLLKTRGHDSTSAEDGERWTNAVRVAIVEAEKL